MKSGRIDFAFDTSLMVGLRIDIGDGKFKPSFEKSLTLQLATKGVYSLFFTLAPYPDSVFSSQEHVSSMRITFLKLFEKIITSGLS